MHNRWCTNRMNDVYIMLNIICYIIMLNIINSLIVLSLLFYISISGFIII